MTDSKHPLASVIVPSYNRPDRLARCLEALMAQDDPSFEVIVIDDGSDTPLAEVCARFGPKVRCIRQENAGAGPARNRAVAEAKGAFLAFTDDDCCPHPTWLRTLRLAHAGEASRLVGGAVVNGLPANPFSTASQELCDYLYEYFGAAEGRMTFFTTNNMACSRAVFLEICGFDSNFPRAGAEDRDFGLRWTESGRQLLFVPEAIVDHFHEMTLRKFLRQHWNYGRGARILHKVMAARRSEAPRVEPFRFYCDLVLWPLRKRGLAGVGSMILMALTQVSMVAGYGYDWYAERKGPS